MAAAACDLGLRVDVDTYRGTRDGVPALLRILSARRLRATFFFTVGPDNMGRHVWRLARPRFLHKMLRSRAPSLYGWDILLRGTLWPGPVIGRRLADVIRAAAREGHEIGLHAWDHHLWQTRLDHLDRAAIGAQLRQGMESLATITGRRPLCSAAAGWRCNEDALLEKDALGFDYNSDCRGTSIFRPVVRDVICAPQVPVTLPTYDELVGRDGVSDANYNERLLGLLRPRQLNVLTVHAEVEGGSRRGLFADFLQRAAALDVSCKLLRDILAAAGPIPGATIVQAELPGREGAVCCQGTALSSGNGMPA